jgi:transglutaminase-like putative cysteine protease
MKKSMGTLIFILMLIPLVLTSSQVTIADTSGSNPGYHGNDITAMGSGKKEQQKKEKQSHGSKEQKKEDGPKDQSGKKTRAMPGPSERTLVIDYNFHVSNMPKSRHTAYAWVPIPPSTPCQTLVDFKVPGNWNYEIVTDRIYGNKYIMLDLNSNKSRKSPNAQVKVTYYLKRSTYQPLSIGKSHHDYDELEMKRYLLPDRLVPIDGNIAHEAENIAGSESNFHIQAKLLFDNIVATVSYDESGFDFTQGDARKTYETRVGNSVDSHSLFVGEARSLSIPSRLVVGVTIPLGSKGDIQLYHSWAEFHDPDYGWIPVDTYKAYQNPEYHDSYFGGLDANRIKFTHGRDIIIPNAKGEPLFYSFYPYVEVNGQVHNDVKTKISYRENSGKGKY